MSTTLPTISALGTSWWIEVFDDTTEKSRQVIHDDCAAFLHTFEEQYSRFKPHSYISRLNTDRIIENPPQELVDLLSFGSAQYERSRGSFNIMVGSALVESGYDATYSFTPTLKKTPLAPPQKALDITSERITLTQGLIDIGGFGKGYAIDALAQLLQEKHHLQYFLINGGGDMYATSDHGSAVTIYLEHPTEASTYLATTTLLDQGFAASSAHKRTWQYAGTTYSHIIPTLPGIAVHTQADATFIKASSACTADIFATVALIVSPVDMEIFATHENLGIASFSLADSTLVHNQAFIDGVRE